MMTKKQARTIFLSKRRQFANGNGHSANHHIYQRLIQQPFFQHASVIHTYISLADEADTHKIVELALAQGKQVIVPRVMLETNSLAHFRIAGFDDLVKGVFGLHEPDPKRCESAEPFCSDLILVPGLAFDQSGNRLGYGKGFYDRFLKDFPGVKCGLAYELQFVEQVPIEPHDIPINVLITEKDTYRF